jgi:ubiquinone/menaquinone biosynthesis C-methylase UbiE/uncharacterized protein YbaR (Trm112 family)
LSVVRKIADTDRSSDFQISLVCPRDKSPLQIDNSRALCSQGHEYGVVEGIPVLLLSEMDQTHVEGTRSLAAAAGDVSEFPPLQVSSGEIDPFVQRSIAATNGAFYIHLIGKLKEYPIPNLQLPSGNGNSFLEIGCSWGRWCIAAERNGYRPTGVDPSLKGIRAAHRVAEQMDIEAKYLVADGRALPFPDESFDQVFSYSVLQHLSKINTRQTLHEIRRILRPGGNCLIQMPNVFGIRCLYHQMRRGFREAHDFEVRYWTVRELISVFQQEIGPAKVFVDGYFSLNPQISDLRFMPFQYRAIVRFSEVLRKASKWFRPLIYVADSLYVSATRK